MDATRKPSKHVAQASEHTSAAAAPAVCPGTGGPWEEGRREARKRGMMPSPVIPTLQNRRTVGGGRQGPAGA